MFKVQLLVKICILNYLMLFSSFKFGSIGSTVENELPLGTIVHSLNTKPVLRVRVAWNTVMGY